MINSRGHILDFTFVQNNKTWKRKHEIYLSHRSPLAVIVRIPFHSFNQQDYVTIPENAEIRRSNIHYKRVCFI